MSTTSAIILRFTSQYSIYVNCTLFCTGIVSNFINILIFTYTKYFRNNRYVFYLVLESISTTAFQICSLVAIIWTLLNGTDLAASSIVWCRLRYALGQGCGLTTWSMICCTAVDQFFATNHQVRLRQMCTIKLARYLVFGIIAFWFTHGIAYALFVNIRTVSGCSTADPFFLRYETFFFYPVLTGLLPIALSSFFSLLAYRNVRRIVRRQLPIERRRLDQQLTAMVLFHVAFTVFFSLPYVIYRVFIINVTVTQADPLRFAIVKLIQAIVVSLYNLNNTATFFIFIAASSRYRRQVKYVLVKKCWRQCKIWCRSHTTQVQPETITCNNATNLS